MSEDPGVQGTKLSKSGGEERIEARNKSYGKVLDAQIGYVRAVQSGAENVEESRTRWLKKSEWHEKEFGW